MPAHIIAVIRPCSNLIIRRRTSKTSQSRETDHSPVDLMQLFLILGFDRLERLFLGVPLWICLGVLRLLVCLKSILMHPSPRSWMVLLSLVFVETPPGSCLMAVLTEHPLFRPCTPKPKLSSLAFDSSSPQAEINTTSFWNQTLLLWLKQFTTKIAHHGSSALFSLKLGLCSASSQPCASNIADEKPTQLLTGLQKPKPKLFSQRIGSPPPLLLCLICYVLIC